MADRTALPKRFYEVVTVTSEGPDFALRLDGKAVMTPARTPLRLPTGALAEALADEWRAQAGVIDPATMPLTRLANSAFDGVADRADEVAADIARYAGSDLVMYRAGEPARLVAAQAAAWDPVLAYARHAIGARFLLSEGVMFVEQPAEALGRVRQVIDRMPAPFGLAALHVMTTLTGSVLISLQLLGGDVDLAEAWRAAHVDELFQEDGWGQDHEAAERRVRREAEFGAAHRLYVLSGAASPV